MDPFGRMIDLVSLVVGPCAVVYSIVSLIRTRIFVLRSLEVDGAVVRLDRMKNGRYSYYAPVFAFTPAEGATYTVISDIGSIPPGFRIGEQGQYGVPD